jgi:hypothetical protein
LSETWSFLADLDLTKPQLLEPQLDAWWRYGQAVRFGWQPVPGAQGYRLTVHQRNADLTVGGFVDQMDSGFFECPGNPSGRVCGTLSGVSTNPDGYCWWVSAAGPGGLAGVEADPWCYGRSLGGATPGSRPLPDPAVSPAGAFPGWPDSSARQAGPARARAGRDGLGET